MINFNIEVGKKANKCPAGEIIFNDKIIHSGEYNKDSFELNPVIGTNTLSISLKNKNDKDTVLKGNKITEDIFVIVKDIQCQITKDSTNQFDTIGSYITDKGEDIKTHG